MASYDTSTQTISSMNVAQHDILRLTAPTQQVVGGNMNLHMDAFDHDLDFSGDLLSRDDLPNPLPSLPFTPSYDLSDAFSSTFEDPFSYQSTTFESLLDSNDNTLTSNTETAPSDLDNKLLSFGAPLLKTAVLDDGGQTWPAMSAELYGMFFVAEDVFGGSENTGRPLELTCYRRNLFQISGTVTLSRSIAHILNEQGVQCPVYDLSVTISALESIEGKNTEIISVPWKTSAVVSSEEKAGAAPPKWPLDLNMNPELDAACVSIPIAWKRLQFKHATANNGRRKGLQQHYVIQINLLATLGTGESVKVAEIRSGPIIVRGRSPRNFDSRKDVSLSERKLESKPRTMSSGDASQSQQSVKVDPSVATSSYRFYALNQLQQPLDLPDWSTQSNTPLLSPSLTSPVSKRLSTNPNTHLQQRPPIPKTKWKSSSSSNTTTTTLNTNPNPTPTLQSHSSNSLPIDLSLAEDDPYNSNSFNSAGRKGIGIGIGGSGGGSGGGLSPEMLQGEGRGMGRGDGSGRGKGLLLGSPPDNTSVDADLLYEYFPLSIDDWMPPVDAIYRPHVVHHTALPPDLKALQVKNRTKRYFSADD